MIFIIILLHYRRTQKVKFCLTKCVDNWIWLNDIASAFDLLTPISRELDYLISFILLAYLLYVN